MQLTSEAERQVRLAALCFDITRKLDKLTPPDAIWQIPLTLQVCLFTMLYFVLTFRQKKIDVHAMTLLLSPRLPAYREGITETLLVSIITC
jgi:hypothetical protein